MGRYPVSRSVTQSSTICDGCNSHNVVEFVDHDREDRSVNQQTRPGSSRAAKGPMIEEDNQADTEYTSEPDQEPLDQLQDFPSGEEIDADLETGTTQPDLAHYLPEQSLVHTDYKSSPQLSKRSRSDFLQSPSLVNSASQSLAFKSSWPCQTQHEARLFHYYIKVMAPWVGYCLPV